MVLEPAPILTLSLMWHQRLARAGLQKRAGTPGSTARAFAQVSRRRDVLLPAPVFGEALRTPRHQASDAQCAISVRGSVHEPQKLERVSSLW